ncbi:hypothetical protein OQA88_11555 [Cercophora sp. LCS_1]
MPNPAPLKKTTHTFAIHEISLECDVYEASDYPDDSPAFLFFHSGGLVGGARIMIPPWLVQACFQRKWPLVSAEYRLLPQVDGKALLDDARAAYSFAQTVGGQTGRRVIVGGASAGFFFGTLIAYHLSPKPLALFSITGIPTFKHEFFNSSVLIPSEPISEDDVEPYISEPVTVGKHVFDARGCFDLEQLRSDGSKNLSYTPKTTKVPGFDRDPDRGLLYDYYLYENLFVDLVGDVDPGFDWTKDESQKRKLADWPVTIFIQGDDDDDVSPKVWEYVAGQLGEKAVHFEAKGQGHLFEKSSYLEDFEDGAPAAVVKKAIEELDRVVGGT